MKLADLIIKAIAKATSGNNVFIADLGTQENMQAMGALDTRLPAWLAQETSEMHQDGEERDRTPDSLGVTTQEDRLKMRPDIMMVDLTANDLSDIESRAPKKCKANGEQTTLEKMIGRKKITVLEITGYVADTRYDDKYKAKIQQHRSVCQILEKKWHEVKLYPIILGTQGSVSQLLQNCHVYSRSPGPTTSGTCEEAAQSCCDTFVHAVTSLSKIGRSRRF